MNRVVTTFDRYVLRRFWHVFAIGFLATYGLFVVFDAFSNADEFQGKDNRPAHVVALRMLQYYTLRSIEFLDYVGPTLAVISVMAVFALLQRQREIFPVLSAGVPTYRLAVPVLVGVLSIVLVITINQEVVIPRFADQLQANRGQEKATIQRVEIARDFVSEVTVTGKKLHLSERRIEDAEFLLPVGSVVFEPVTLRAREAIHFPAKGNRAAGWLLKDAQPAFAEIRLTDHGRTLVYGRVTNPDSRDLYVETDVTIDQLHSRGSSIRYLSTADIVQRIRNPAFGLIAIRGLTERLHERLTRPLGIVFFTMIAIPLTMKKESRSLIANLALATLVLGALFGVSLGAVQLGKINVVPLAFAAWVPLVLAGTVAMALSNRVQT